MANIVLGSGVVYWTPAGGSETALAETPALSLAVTWEWDEQWHLPAGATALEMESLTPVRVRRTGAFEVQDITSAALSLWLAVGGPTKGRVRFVANNAVGTNRNLDCPTVVLYPVGQVDLKDRRTAQRLRYEFVVEVPANGTAPWALAVPAV